MTSETTNHRPNLVFKNTLNPPNEKTKEKCYYCHKSDPKYNGGWKYFIHTDDSIPECHWGSQNGHPYGASVVYYCDKTCYESQDRDERFAKRLSKKCENCKTRDNMSDYWTVMVNGYANKASNFIDTYFCSQECLDYFKKTEQCRNCGRGSEDSLLQVVEGDNVFVLCRFGFDNPTCYDIYQNETRYQKAFEKRCSKLCTECKRFEGVIEYNTTIVHNDHTVTVFFCDQECLTEFMSSFSSKSE